MRSNTRQRIGSGIAILGLGLLITGGALMAAPTAGAAEATSEVCENIHEGENPVQCDPDYGTVDWDVVDDQLVLHVTANEGVGWSDVRVCAPYGLPTQHADCQPKSDGLLAPAAYTVEMEAPAGAVANATASGYQFEACGSEFIIRVPMSAIGGQPSDFWWAMHLAPGNGGGSGEGCGGVGAGQTHEAFGRVQLSVDETTTTTSTSTTTSSTTTTTTTTTTAPQNPTTSPGDGGAAPVDTAVLGEQLVNDPQVIGGTLPRTGTATSEQLALAGLAFLLGGIAIRFGQPATER